jgi:hypothetical protein
MKKILFSLFLILILTSCSKQKKEAALENCADNNYKKTNSYFRDFKVEAQNLIEKDEKHKKLLAEELEMERLINQKEKLLDILTEKYLSENPFPFAKKLEDIIDITRTDISLDEVKKVKIKINNDLINERTLWKEKQSNYLFEIKEIIELIKTDKTNVFFERVEIKMDYTNNIFSKLNLKQKSKYNSYLEKYAKCENDYNKTPNAFLLEWQKS